MARDHAGATPLHRAAYWSRNRSISEALLAAGADPNAHAGDTPLSLAARRTVPNQDTVELLIRAGADSRTIDDTGSHPRRGPATPR